MLLGTLAPAGRLAETIPHRLADTPAYASFPGEHGHVRHGEGVLVGYRWYDTRELDVAYPFGHGLTYTTFGYDDVRAQVHGEGADVAVTVSVRVTNTGEREGVEVVQVYVRDPQASVQRPVRELRAFRRVPLAPGESADLTFELGARDLAFWHPAARRWFVEGGAFVIEVGASSRDVRGSAEVEVVGEQWFEDLSATSTFGQWLDPPVGRPLLLALLGTAVEEIPEGEARRWVDELTLDAAAAFGLAGLTPDHVETLLAELPTP